MRVDNQATEKDIMEMLRKEEERREKLAKEEKYKKLNILRKYALYKFEQDIDLVYTNQYS